MNLPTAVQAVALLLALAAFSLAIRAIVAREKDPGVLRILLAGFIVKVIGTVAYFVVLEEVYGTGDANRYFRVGSELAPIIMSGTLPDQAKATGTPFMEFLSGLVMAATGPSIVAGYAVFSALSLLGMYLFYRAFVLGVPEGNHRRYALLLFLLPTMIFWPSTIGKESWLVFTLGFASYGAARALRREATGLAIVLLGAAGMYAVRPHMAVLFGLSFAIAYVLRFRSHDVRRGALAWLLGLAIVSMGTAYALLNFGDELASSERDYASVTDQVIDETESIFEHTTQMTRRGESEFDSRPVRGLGDLGHAVLTVPFRPFPWEAHNLQAQLSGFEGIFLLGLFLLSIPRLASLPRSILRSPYVAMATAYALGFIVAFSHVGNFGILTRQRSQLIPLLLVLLALPVADGRLTRRRHAPGRVLVPMDELPPDTRDELLSRRPSRHVAAPEPAASNSMWLVVDIDDDVVPDRSPPG